MNTYRLSMVIYNLEDKYTPDELLAMFCEWAESKDLFVGGSLNKEDGINKKITKGNTRRRQKSE